VVRKCGRFLNSTRDDDAASGRSPSYVGSLCPVPFLVALFSLASIGLLWLYASSSADCFHNMLDTAEPEHG
jgi:hypothetical protein